jgi:queuine tRNA-ribosyltransferase
MLLSWANVAFYQELMAAMRAAIAERRFAAWAAQTKTRLAARGQSEELADTDI